MKKKSVNVKYVFILLVLAVFLVSGQQECAGPGGPGGVSQGVDQARQQIPINGQEGIDFSFREGIEYLSKGKEVRANEEVFLNILVTNQDDSPKAGEVCIRDDVEDIYGGVISQCKPFTITGAVYDGGKIVDVGEVPVLFGVYTYEEFPLNQDVTVFATLKYADSVQFEGFVSIPGEETEKVQISKKASPLTATVDKRVSLKGGGYNVDLTIKFTKDRKVKVFSPDYLREGLILDPRISTQSMYCDYTDSTVKFLEFKEGSSTSIIKCQALLPKEESTKYPLLLSTQYGVELEKKFTFKLKKEEPKLA